MGGPIRGIRGAIFYSKYCSNKTFIKSKQEFIWSNHVIIHPIVIFIQMVTIFILCRNNYWIYHCMFEIFCHFIFRKLNENKLYINQATLDRPKIGRSILWVSYSLRGRDHLLNGRVHMFSPHSFEPPKWKSLISNSS